MNETTVVKHIGFTGTQRGMTPAQAAELKAFLVTHKDTIESFRHGDCIGADEEAHNIAAEVLGEERIYIHPPADNKKQAFCESPHILPPREYLTRNLNIVRASDIVIAAPKSEIEELRSGTWSTVRRAREMNRPVMILQPRT